MKLDARALASASALLMALLYILCVLVVVLAPEAYTRRSEPCSTSRSAARPRSPGVTSPPGWWPGLSVPGPAPSCSRASTTAWRGRRRSDGGDRVPAAPAGRPRRGDRGPPGRGTPHRLGFCIEPRLGVRPNAPSSPTPGADCAICCGRDPLHSRGCAHPPRRLLADGTPCLRTRRWPMTKGWPATAIFLVAGLAYTIWSEWLNARCAPPGSTGRRCRRSEASALRRSPQWLVLPPFWSRFSVGARGPQACAGGERDGGAAPGRAQDGAGHAPLDRLKQRSNGSRRQVISTYFAVPLPG